jgi:hypothetical protein
MAKSLRNIYVKRQFFIDPTLYICAAFKKGILPAPGIRDPARVSSWRFFQAKFPSVFILSTLISQGNYK